jgi:hypothetical protein
VIAVDRRRSTAYGKIKKWPNLAVLCLILDGTLISSDRCAGKNASRKGKEIDTRAANRRAFGRQQATQRSAGRRPVARVCYPAGRRRIAGGLPVAGWPALTSLNRRNPQVKWQMPPPPACPSGW